MSFSPRIDDLLRRFDTEPMAATARWELGRTAERFAEEDGNQEALYAVRMRLVGFAHEVADSEAQLSLFLWCAYTHDSDPARFPTKPIVGQPDIDLLWWYKWLVGMLLAFPQYSLAQVNSALDMMKSAYRREGVGMSGVEWARLHYLLEAGSDEEIREQLARVKTVPVDEYSDCEACSRAVEASARWRLGDGETALALFDDIIEGGFMCGEEPETIMSEALVPLLEAGRVIEAVQMQMFSYPRVMRTPAHLGTLGDHMMFFLATENPQWAFELLARHLSFLWHEGLSPAGQLGALLRLIRVTSILSASGYGERQLPGTDSPEARAYLGAPRAGSANAHTPLHTAGTGPAEGLEGHDDLDGHEGPTVDPLTIDSFLELARAKAAPLAKAFDERNGNTKSMDLLTRAGEPLEKTYPVDLGGAPRETR